MPMVAPRHGLVMMGGGTVIIGLTPPEPISVEPNGIPVGRTVDPVLPREGTAPPPEMAVVDPIGQPDAELIVPLMPLDADMADPLTPPPSKGLITLAALTGPPNTVAPQPPGKGLKPPGLISVAPRGIPVPIEPTDGSIVPIDPIVPVELLMPGVPRGEVTRMPEGGGTMLCACRVAHPNRITVVMANARRTASPFSSLSPNMREGREAYD